MASLTEEELFEARSMRYVDAARVVRLASGKFVIFSMTRGEVVGVAEEPEILTALGSAIFEACQRSGEFWASSRAEEIAGRDPAIASIAASAADLGL